MTGWKTWLGGLCAILLGVAGFIWGFVSDDLALAFIMAGFGAMGVLGIGLGHKLEKAGNGTAKPE